jgi:hypothetical protein
MNKNYDLEDAIMQLHGIARLIEREIGFGSLAKDIRLCADRLDTLTSPLDIPAAIDIPAE